MHVVILQLLTQDADIIEQSTRRHARLSRNAVFSNTLIRV